MKRARRRPATSQQHLDETVPVPAEATPSRTPGTGAGADGVRQNPYYGLPGDPYGGEQFIPDGASVINGRPVGASGSPLPGYRQQPPPCGQTIDAHGNRIVEPRSFGSHSSVTPPSMSMPSNTTAATFADRPLSNASERYHHDHDVRPMLVGAAVGGAAAYASITWWNNRTERERRTIKPFLWAMGLAVVTWVVALGWSFVSVFTTHPGVGLDGAPMDNPAANTFANILVYGGPILIAVLLVLWIGMKVASKQALRPTDAERQAAYEQRIAVLIAEYDRQRGTDPRMLGP